MTNGALVRKRSPLGKKIPNHLIEILSVSSHVPKLLFLFDVKNTFVSSVIWSSLKSAS
jgi:hypothetical protein